MIADIAVAVKCENLTVARQILLYTFVQKCQHFTKFLHVLFQGKGKKRVLNKEEPRKTIIKFDASTKIVICQRKKLSNVMYKHL